MWNCVKYSVDLRHVGSSYLGCTFRLPQANIQSNSYAPHVQTISICHAWQYIDLHRSIIDSILIEIDPIFIGIDSILIGIDSILIGIDSGIDSILIVIDSILIGIDLILIVIDWNFRCSIGCQESLHAQQSPWCGNFSLKELPNIVSNISQDITLSSFRDLSGCSLSNESNYEPFNLSKPHVGYFIFIDNYRRFYINY